MLARDLMTTDVVTVTPETPAREIAHILLDHRVSAVPVIDTSGAPVGIVSEGDLIGRTEADRISRHDWWLRLFASTDAQHSDFLSQLRRNETHARDIMSAPVVTVNETTDATEVARVLSAYRIKRVPVIRDGRVVGIVSRADLLRAVAGKQPTAGPAPVVDQGHGLLSKAVAALDDRFFRGHRDEPIAPHEGSLSARSEGGLTVADFRSLVADFDRQETRDRDEKQHAAAEQRKEAMKELIDHHIADEHWKDILQHAREAAAHGAKELLVLRFPSSLCTDSGRAINAPLPDWPKTLRGEAAEIYLRWERELKPRGFHLSARVLDFPGGMPGDIGLFIVWGE